MADFFGTDFQIAIQKRMIERHNWIVDTPAVANGGRVMNFLDPETTGWDRIKEFVGTDGAVGITAMPRKHALDRLRDIFGQDYDFPIWNVYTASAVPALMCCDAILNEFIADIGWRLDCLTCPNDAELDAVQALNLATGVAPLSGPYLRSELVPSFTSYLWTPDGTLVATSNVTARYHPQSRLAGYAFNGSTSTAPEHRGQGLGKVVTAHALTQSHHAIGWTHVLAQVAPDNVPSHHMVTACGLNQDPSLVTMGVTKRGVVLTR